MADDPQSPTQLVQAYLASKGLPVTAQNVSRALQMNADKPGSIPGLTNQAPPPPDAQATATAPSARRPAPKPQAQQPLPVPPPPPVAPSPVAASLAASGDNGNWMNALLAMLGGGGAAGLGALMGMHGGAGGDTAQVGVGGNGAAEPMGNRPMPPTGRVMDVPGAAISGPGQPPQIAGPGQQQLQGPQAGDAMESAMFKALNGGQAAPQVAGPQGAALPAPQPAAPIRMPDQTGGPPIELPTSGLSGMGDALPSRPAMPEMGSGIDWSKILGEVAPLLKRLHP